MGILLFINDSKDIVYEGYLKFKDENMNSPILSI